MLKILLLIAVLASAGCAQEVTLPPQHKVEQVQFPVSPWWEPTP